MAKPKLISMADYEKKLRANYAATRQMALMFVPGKPVQSLSLDRAFDMGDETVIQFALWLARMSNESMSVGEQLEAVAAVVATMVVNAANLVEDPVDGKKRMAEYIAAYLKQFEGEEAEDNSLRVEAPTIVGGDA